MLTLAMLRLAEAEPACIGTVREPAGWGCRREIGGHHVLDLHGTDAAIGRMYATLLRDEMSASYLPMVEGMLADLPSAFRWALARHETHFPDFFSPEMDARALGVEEALHLKAGTLRHYAWLSELGSVGPALKVATSGMLQLDGLTGRPTGGCTSFVAEGGGSTFHARNVDFWGMSYWQQHAAIVFVEPLDERGAPDGFRYLQVSDLGEIFAGITGVNEKGLVLTTHLHVTRDVTLLNGDLHLSSPELLWRAVFGPRKQAPVAVLRVVETVLRRAADVPQAIAMMREFRTAGAWSFILSDPAGGRAVVGMNSRDMAVTPGATVMTNLYLDPAMHAREMVPARGPVEGARLRYERASALVKPRAGNMDVTTAVDILRDRFDLATGDERAASPNSVLSPDATQSVVIVTRPGEDPVLWAAVPHGDGVTPAPLAPYFSIPFSAGFAGSTCSDDCLSESIPYIPDPLDAAATAYAHAMSKLLDHHDPLAAVAILRAIPGDDPGIHLMAAWLAASAADLTIAASELDLARRSSRPMSTHHHILAAFLGGTLARAQGDEALALTEFAAALALATEDPGPNADLNALLVPAIKSRLNPRGRALDAISAPDLKFQDVFGTPVAP